MRVLFDNNGYNYITFNAKKVPKNITKTAGTGLTNESVALANKIKDYLIKLTENGTTLTQEQIAKNLGLTYRTVNNRIQKNDELKQLWDKVYSIALDESRGVSEKIKAVLEDIIETGENVTDKDIAQRTGMNISACKARIQRNKELLSLYKQINHKSSSQKTEESQRIDTLIKEFIENSILNGIKIFTRDIAEKIGLSRSKTTDRIYRTPELKALWEQAGHIKTKDRIKVAGDKKDILKSVIQKAIDEHRPITLRELPNVTHMTYYTCSNIIQRNPDIKALLEKAKQISGKKPKRAIISDEARATIIEKIEGILQKACNENIVIISEDIAKELNINDTQVRYIIYNNSKLSDLWKQLGHLGKEKKQYFKEKYSKIQDILNRAINTNTSIGFDEMEQEVGLPALNIKYAVYANKELKALWDRTPKRYIHYDTEMIKQAMEDAILQKRPMSIKELSGKTGISERALWDKMKKKPELREIWRRIQEEFPKEQQPDDIHKKIISILENAIKTKTIIYAKKVAELAGIEFGALNMRLNNRKGGLYELWQQVLNLKSEERDTLDNKIKQILKESLKKRKEVLLDELSKRLGIKEHVIRYRFSESPELKTLWLKVKNIEIDTFKDFCDLKIKKYDYKDIMKELNLSEDKFEELNLKYNNIQSIIELHKDRGTTDKEILDWLLLSKREFELAINEIFQKMGYNSKTTRYINDNGIDVVAKKDDKTTIIECMHNINMQTEIEELLALWGNKYYYNADNVIYVASSGVHKNGKKFVDAIGEKFEILDLADVIKLAKEHNVDIHNLKEGRDINSVPSQEYRGNWILPSTLNEAETKKWRSMKPKAFERIVTEYLTSEGYAVKRLEELNLDGFYHINKGGKTSIIKCHNKNSLPNIDEVKALYGLKDFYNTDRVILIGPSRVSGQSKDYIDTINSKKTTKDSYKLYSLDDFLKLINDN